MTDARPGDPEGRRIARRRSQCLSEAGRLASALEVLLKRANFPADDCQALARLIAEAERREIHRAAGRIEPRQRFRGGPVVRPASELARPYLYVDESGKSGAFAHDPFFALAGIAISGAAALAYREAADALKTTFFGTTELTFHEPLMRHADGPYNFEGNRSKQAEFRDRVDDLVRSTEFTVFGVGIRKKAFQREFVEAGLDPYLPADVYALAIHLLLERYVDFLAFQGGPRVPAQVVFESQGPLEDAVHQRDYVGVLIDGTQWVAASAFRQWLRTGLVFTPKRGSDPTELADMASRDLFEWIRDECTSNPGRWAVLAPKVYLRGDGARGKFGIKVFPDSDIRGLIEKHRASCIGAQTKSASPEAG